MNSLHCPLYSPASASEPPASCAPAPSPWQHHTLPADAPARLLTLRPGETAVLQATQGRLWVTCEGWLEDYFLSAEQSLACDGPARLHIGAADAGAAARIACWRQRSPGGQARPLRLPPALVSPPA